MLSVGNEKKSVFEYIFPPVFLRLCFFLLFGSVDERFPSSGLEGSVVQVSDQGLRKVLYQKVWIQFPRSCYSFSVLTFDFDIFNFITISALTMKKKLEKEAMEQGEDD